jgi:thiol-disulfide isomerase/thioredoxin
MSMATIPRVVAILLFLGIATVGAEPQARQDQEPGAATAEPTDVQAPVQSRPATLKEQFAALWSEWAATEKAAVEARKTAASPAEKQAVFARMKPDALAFCRRFLTLSEAHPDDPGSRDALLWIIMRETTPFAGSRAGSLGIDPTSEVLGRAVDLLIEHHANDLQVARTTLCLQNHASLNRDRLFRSLYDRARDRAVKATSALALAQYLDLESKYVAGIQRSRRHSPLLTEEHEKQLLNSDAGAMKAESEQILERLIADYGDVPYAIGGDMTDSVLGPAWRASTALERARNWTLAQAAESRLDEMRNLIVGKPAPEIDGIDFEGRPLKLSDYRGKVVVLVFWGTWCGPCMNQVPHERELVERLKDQPFALLGVDCIDDKETARKVMQREKMTWPNWYDGTSDEGPIAQRYHVTGFPSIFVLDAKGIIRIRGPRGKNLDQAVDMLLKEMNPPATSRTDAS